MEAELSGTVLAAPSTMPDKTAVMRSPPNKLGKYEIRKLLGKGNMGMVFLAHDPVLERDVAIKVMAGSSINDAEMRERFEREAKAVARLHHPNIVTIHDLGYDHQGSPFIAMELLEGTDLEHLVKMNPASVIRRLEIVAQVCRGLHHAHGAGIVHRDVKPANIFVTQDGAKIMDFGVARWMKSSQTQSGMVLGTAGYMSPEQIRGERVDGRSDIFSVGIVLYQLLTNEKLFSGDSIETVFFKTLSQDPPELVMPDGRNLPEFQEIVSSALASDAEDRYSSAEKMTKAIETFLGAHSAALPEKLVFRALDPDSALRSSGGKGSLRQLSHGAKRPGGTDAAEVPAHATLTLIGSARPVPSKVMPATEVRPAPVKRPTPSKSRIRPTRVARPPAPSRLPRVAAAVVLLGVAVGAYLLVFHRPESSPPPASASASSTAPVDLEKRFQFAEGLLENGQIAQAFEAVQNILTIEPGNPRALELQEAVRKAADVQAKSKPAQPSPPVEKLRPVPSSKPTLREQAATFAADAASALSNGQLEEADSPIARGQRLDPKSPRWSDLGDQLRAKQAEAELKSLAAQYVQQGSLSLEGGNYQGAIDAYKKAMEYEPESREARNGLDRAISLKHQAEAKRQAAAAPARRFVESKTEFTPSQSDTEEVVGFEMEDRFKVNETADPFFPAKIIIELNPTDAKPGEPYVLRVRVFNEGYRPIEVRSLELVSRFGGKTTGKGAQIPTRVQRIDPQATALVHEITGTWKEAQHQGEISATVTLADGGTFSKSISW